MPDYLRQIAIGDVHGCVHALDTLLEAISPTADDQLIFLGDLIDQGHESRDVLDRLIAVKQQCSLVLIEGNHEEMMFASRESEKALRYWENCGGMTTLNSFRFGGSLKDIPDKYWKLLEESLPYYETEADIFTHANYLPDVSMSAQPGYQLRWALFDPERMQPHESGKRLWLGHTEHPEIVDLGFATCIDTACWRYGWLTAVDVRTNQVWQTNRWGSLRDAGEPSQRNQLSRLLKKKPGDVAAAAPAG